MWNKKKAITRSNSSDATSFLSTTNRFHCCEAGSFCIDVGKLCIEAGKLEVVVGFVPHWGTFAEHCFLFVSCCDLCFVNLSSV
jgi:hypothetical protein